MMKNCCYFFILFLLITTSVKAESLDADNDSVSLRVSLEEVVISSFKQQQDISRLPVAASVVNISDINQRNITQIKDIGAVVPNLFMPDYGSKLTSPVYIRGVGSKINSPSVGLYVDGIPYFEKSSMDFDFDQISRIEVLRGPQGTLYGRNTMGGLINVQTHSPLQYQGTRFRLSGSQYTLLHTSLSNYGKIGDDLGYGISASYRKDKGYFENSYTGDEADDLESAAARLRLNWKSSDKMVWGLTSSYEYMMQGGYPYGIFDESAGLASDVNYNDYSSYKRVMATAGLRADYKGEGFLFNSQCSWQYLSDNQKIDQDFSPADKYFVAQDTKNHTLTEELTFKSSDDNDYKWIVGAFGFYQNSDFLVEMTYKALGYSTPKPSDSPVYGFALYHQSVYDNLFLPGLSLTLGVRYDREFARTTYTSYKQTASEKTQTDHFKSRMDFSQFSPKLSLQYRKYGFQVFAGVTKGYKSGGFNTSFEEDYERTFDPEYSWQYELGTKLNLFDNRLQADFTLFYIDWYNQQVYQTLASGKGSKLTNAGRSESKGVEASLRWRAARGLTLQADYGYTYACFKDYVKSETSDYSGKMLPMVPRQTLNLSADYGFSLNTLLADRLNIGVAYTGAGKIYWSETNETFQPFYGQVNAKIGIIRKCVTLEMWARNLGDEDFVVYYFESMGNKFAQNGRGRILGLNLIVNI